VLEELAADWGDRLKVVKLDIEKNSALAARYDVLGIPTLVLFDGGVERLRLVNVVRRRAIEIGLSDVLV
jgi:thioredoxin 1